MEHTGLDTALLVAIVGAAVAWLVACALVMAITRVVDGLRHGDPGPVLADGHCLYVTPNPEIPGDSPEKRRERVLAARARERRV